jgi:hypothetical protein
MQPGLHHQRCVRRDLDQLMPQRLWILTLQQGAAAAAGIGVVIHHRIHALDWQQLRTSAGMTLLAAAFAATALGSF